METILIAILVYTILLVLFIVGITLFYVFKKRRFNNYIEAVKVELNKINQIERKRSELLTKELALFASWLNSEFPNELQLDLMTNKQFLKLKDKYVGKDEDFYTALGEISLVIQNTVGKRSQDSFNKVNKIVMAEAHKLLIKDSKV